MVFSPDGTTLASASADNTVKLWDGASKSRNRYPRRAYVLGHFGGIFAGWDNAGFRVSGWHGQAVGRGEQEQKSLPSKGIRILVFGGIFAEWDNAGFRVSG